MAFQKKTEIEPTETRAKTTLTAPKNIENFFEIIAL